MIAPPVCVDTAQAHDSLPASFYTASTVGEQGRTMLGDGWQRYFSELVADGLLFDTIPTIAIHWAELVAAVTGVLPNVVPTSEKGLHMAWRAGRRRFTIDLDAAGLADWYYADLATHDEASGRMLLRAAPATLYALLSRLKGAAAGA